MRWGDSVPKRPTVNERTRLQNCEQRRLKWRGERRRRATTAILEQTRDTDTHLLDFIFLLSDTKKKKKLRLAEGGKNKKTPFSSLRLNSKSGCDSEGIHSLHPLSEWWCWDYYARWKRLKVTKLGFICPLCFVCPKGVREGSRFPEFSAV